MKLHHSPASPYVRKVRVAAHELGVYDRLDLIEATVRNVVEQVSPDSPLAQIPTLVLDDSTVLYDSTVICDYLDTLNEGVELIPSSGAARWLALRQQALGDAMLDTAIAIRRERLRGKANGVTAAAAREDQRLARCLETLEVSISELECALTIGQIAVACALGYLDFRLTPDYWRPAHPALAVWFDRFSARPSMQATLHPPAAAPSRD